MTYPPLAAWGDTVTINPCVNAEHQAAKCFGENAEGYATLFAAAPKLLEALELIQSAVIGLETIPQASTKVIQKTVADAISKATGVES
jgi:hypothetical protein